MAEGIDVKATEASGATDVPGIGVGMLGYAFMGMAHANAYRTIPYMTWPPPMLPELVAVAGTTDEKVAEAADRYGFARHSTALSGLLQAS